MKLELDESGVLSISAGRDDRVCTWIHRPLPVYTNPVIITVGQVKLRLTLKQGEELLHELRDIVAKEEGHGDNEGDEPRS